MPAPRAPARHRHVTSAAVAAAALVGVLGAGAATVHSTAAAFSRTSATSTTFTASTVVLSDDDSGAALVTADNLLARGVAYSRCLTVTYSGSAPAAVVLYASAGSDTEGMGAVTTLRVEQGTGGGFGSCSGFVPAATLYNGALSTFLTTVNTPAAGVGSWNPTGSGQSRTYRFTSTLAAGASASVQSAVATATVTWVARAGS